MGVRGGLDHAKPRSTNSPLVGTKASRFIDRSRQSLLDKIASIHQACRYEYWSPKFRQMYQNDLSVSETMISRASQQLLVWHLGFGTRNNIHFYMDRARS
jgi:hypothetical protein